MILIKKIYKKEIPAFFNDSSFWKHDFLSISKHRLYAHYKNPSADDDDVILLLAYMNEELVGYMGVFIDKIVLDNVESKIGWLSTWWVHPKTKGTGVGREILNTMYEVQNKKIGISQFTPSAKRVYDKSGYFVDLKQNIGIKAVLRSNLIFVIPTLYPKLKSFNPLWNLIDNTLNIFVDIKLNIQKSSIQSRLKNVKLEYVNYIDDEILSIITTHSKNHISPKKANFFEWMKAYHWVQEAPLLGNVDRKKYEFSSYDKHFNIYLIKIIEKNECLGFVVLQKRNYVLKVLFSYYDEKYSQLITDIVVLQSIHQNVREIICYDEIISKEMNKSSVFLYKTKKIKQSIISKSFNKERFDDVIVNFGDGDCSFA